MIISAAFILVLACGSKKKSTENITVETDGNIVTLSPAQLKNAGIETIRLQQKAVSSILKLSLAP